MEATLVLILSIAVAVIFFFVGKLSQRKSNALKSAGKRIEEYEFYPFFKNDSGHIEFSAALFDQAVKYFLHHKEPLAAQQLLIIGEQNLVRDFFSSESLNNYKKFYDLYNGQSILDDNDHYLENYKRIVQLIGKSFPGTGIEILLHNLVNPSKSVIALENGEVTGRKIEDGTTSLVLDLKTRKEDNKDKLNYELNIGSRKFKCTTIPIFRRDFGLVGAICINVDVRFLKEEVVSNAAILQKFIENMVVTDFELKENILSKTEYQKALEGKKHFNDNDYVKITSESDQRHLVAIMFSDIVSYTSMMGSDEKGTLEVLQTNRLIHGDYIKKQKGKLLKEMGDGILASFSSVSNAINCAIDLQKYVKKTGSYQLRIGIHLGEVVISNNDIFGDGVNIAARIQNEAGAGEICISEVVYDNIRNKLETESELIGEKILKNVRDRIKIFRIRP